MGTVRRPNRGGLKTICGPPGKNGDDDIGRVARYFLLKITLRNFWYFLYNPGWLHSRYNPIPIFHGGLFYPLDGQVAIGGPLFGANAAMAGLPPAATREIGFDTLSAQPKWIRHLYSGIRTVWLGGYDAAMRVLFFLMVAAWAAMLLDGAAACSWFARLRRGADVVCAGRLGAHVLYTTVFLLYNAGVTAAFAEPDYRYNHMTLLLKIVPAAYGLVALCRLVRFSAPALGRRK